MSFVRCTSCRAQCILRIGRHPSASMLNTVLRFPLTTPRTLMQAVAGSPAQKPSSKVSIGSQCPTSLECHPKPSQGAFRAVARGAGHPDSRSKNVATVAAPGSPEDPLPRVWVSPGRGPQILLHHAQDRHPRTLGDASAIAPSHGRKDTEPFLRRNHPHY